MRRLLKLLDPFYKQHLVAGGVLIVGSEKVTQYAMRETAYLAKKVLANRPDVLKKFGETRMAYVCVMDVPVAKRLDEPHLRGYDPAKAPTFRFQPEAIKAFEVFQRAEAERKAKEQRQNEQEANASANRVPERSSGRA